MGIALALPLIYDQSIRGDTNAHLRADMHSLYGAITTYSAITGGYAYDLLSPQGLAAKLLIYDPSLPGSPVAFQVTSADDLRLGFVHLISPVDDRLFWAHACPCQLLLCSPALNRRTTGFNALQLGVPYLFNVAPAAPCMIAVGPGETTEAWWSASDGGTFDDNNFRLGPVTGGAWSACFNQSLCDGSQPTAKLRLVFPAIALDVPPTFGVRPRTLLRGSGGPLYADPMLAWGMGADVEPLSIAKVRGQMFNCTMPTADNVLDETLTLDGMDFINYMHDDTGTGSRWTSLLLLKTAPAAGSGRANYVY